MKKYYSKFLFICLYLIFLVSGIYSYNRTFLDGDFLSKIFTNLPNGFRLALVIIPIIGILYELINMYVGWLLTQEKKQLKEFLSQNRKGMALYISMIIVCIFLQDYLALAFLGIFIIFESIQKFKQTKLKTYIPFGALFAIELFLHSRLFAMEYSLPIAWPEGMHGAIEQLLVIFQIIFFVTWILSTVSVVYKGITKHQVTIQNIVNFSYQWILGISIIILILLRENAFDLHPIDLFTNIAIIVILLMDFGVNLYLKKSNLN